MRNCTWIRAAALTALVSTVGVAAAQTSVPTGLSVRLGVFLPTDTSLRDVSSTWFNAGVDYKFQNYRVQAPVEGTSSFVGMSVDYYFSHSNSNVPVALTYNVRQGALLYSIGAGVNFYNIDRLGETGTGFGGQVAVSYELGSKPAQYNPLFIQAKYFLVSKSELNGFGIYLGYRF